jgi:antirestriction protein ArdC
VLSLKCRFQDRNLDHEQDRQHHSCRHYTRVTERIIEDLAKGVRPWLEPSNSGSTQGRISPALRQTASRARA